MSAQLPPHNPYPPPRQPAHAAAPRKRRSWPWVVAGVAGLLVIGVGAIAVNAKPSSLSTPSAVSTVPTVATDVATAVPVAPPGPPRKITAREWQQIAKDPGAHVGERVIVYGQVTQFDSATGTDGFRANVDGVKHPVEYGYANGYQTNTVLAGSAALFADVVQKDLFMAEVTVAGSYSYDTQIGGNTTVPKLTVTRIEVIGTAK